MLEYLLAFVALLAAVGIMGYLVRAARHTAQRSESLVSSDYP